MSHMRCGVLRYFIALGVMLWAAKMSSAQSDLSGLTWPPPVKPTDNNKAFIADQSPKGAAFVVFLPWTIVVKPGDSKSITTYVKYYNVAPADVTFNVTDPTKPTVQFMGSGQAPDADARHQTVYGTLKVTGLAPTQNPVVLQALKGNKVVGKAMIVVQQATVFNFIVFDDEPNPGTGDAFVVLSLKPLDIDVGHTWCMFYTSDTSVFADKYQQILNVPLGLGPAPGNLGFFPCPGSVRNPDIRHRITFIQRYDVFTADNLMGGMDVMLQWIANPPGYDLDTVYAPNMTAFNCTSAVIYLAHQCNFNLPNPVSQWPDLPIIRAGAGNSPGGLGLALRTP